MIYNFVLILLISFLSNSYADPAEKKTENTESLVAIKKKYNKILSDDFVIGNAKSSKYMIVYSSFTCHHCADYYNKIFLKVKANLIDKHKIAYVSRSFLQDRLSLTAALLTYCNGKEGYYPMLKVLFSRYDYWVKRSGYLEALKQLVLLGGIDEIKFEQCINNKELQDSLLEKQKEAVEELEIKGTPVFIINGKKFEGALTYDKIIEELNL